MSNQGTLHQAIRALTGTTRSINEDWLALFAAAGFTTGTFNERMLAWLNDSLGVTYTSIAAAQNAYADSQGVSGWGAITEIASGNPLDAIVATATGAYSVVRRLNANYAGNLLRVRRSSDSTEQDIGFSANGNLDQSALTTFVGAGDGFVVTLYDQSGSGRNLTIATAARQPRVVASGVVETVNSKPAINFIAASSHRLESAVAMSALFTNSAYTYLISMTADQGGTGGTTANVPAVVSDATSGYFNLQTRDAGGGDAQIQAANYDTNYDIASVTVTYPVTAVVGVRLSGGTLRCAVNGGTEGTAVAGNMGAMTGTLQMGAQYSDLAHFDGRVCEFVTYNSALSNSDLNTIGAALADVTGTTWTTVT